MDKYSSQKLRSNKIFSILTIFLGTTLMIYLNTVEDEPQVLYQ